MMSFEEQAYKLQDQEPSIADEHTLDFPNEDEKFEAIDEEEELEQEQQVDNETNEADLSRFECMIRAMENLTEGIENLNRNVISLDETVQTWMNQPAHPTSLWGGQLSQTHPCLLYTSPSPRD